jgi:hypothetical protein
MEGAPYFAIAVRYVHKMLTKFTTGVNLNKTFFVFTVVVIK